MTCLVCEEIKNIMNCKREKQWGKKKGKNALYQTNFPLKRSMGFKNASGL